MTEPPALGEVVVDIISMAKLVIVSSFPHITIVDFDKITSVRGESYGESDGYHQTYALLLGGDQALCQLPKPYHYEDFTATVQEILDDEKTPHHLFPIRPENFQARLEQHSRER